jgi:hypothetical protein
MQDTNFSFSGPGWSADFSSGGTEFMRLRLGSVDAAVLRGMSVDGVHESVSCLSKFKRHDYGNVPGGCVEKLAVLPFGVEPVLERRCEYFGNRIKIVSEADFRGPHALGSLSIDSLEIPGSWRASVVLPGHRSNLPHLKELDLLAGASLNFENGIPPAWLFTAEDGTCLEVGSGDDLWRWNSAERLNAQSLFQLKRGDSGYSIVRNVICYEQKTEIQPRKFKFTWYLAWHLPGHKYFSADPSAAAHDMVLGAPGQMQGDVLTADIRSPEWPQMSHALLNGATSSEGVCFHSDAVWNALRRFVRKAAPPAESGRRSIVIRGAEPFLCDNASHCGRPEKIRLLHWNVTALMDFKLWAERQLSNSGAHLHLVPAMKNEISSLLPSIRGLSLVPPE